MDESILWLIQQQTSPETVWYANWLTSLISLGGFGVLLYLLLSRRLIHPETFNQMLEEKDRQLEKCDADVKEWKAAYFTEREAREKAEDTRQLESQRSDAAVEAAKLAANALDALRTELLRGGRSGSP